MPDQDPSDNLSGQQQPETSSPPPSGALPPPSAPPAQAPTPKKPKTVDFDDMARATREDLSKVYDEAEAALPDDPDLADDIAPKGFDDLLDKWGKEPLVETKKVSTTSTTRPRMEFKTAGDGPAELPEKPEKEEEPETLEKEPQEPAREVVAAPPLPPASEEKAIKAPIEKEEVVAAEDEGDAKVRSVNERLAKLKALSSDGDKEEEESEIVDEPSIKPSDLGISAGAAEEKGDDLNPDIPDI